MLGSKPVALEPYDPFLEHPGAERVFCITAHVGKKVRSVDDHALLARHGPFAMRDEGEDAIGVHLEAVAVHGGR